MLRLITWYWKKQKTSEIAVWRNRYTYFHTKTQISIIKLVDVLLIEAISSQRHRITFGCVLVVSHCDIIRNKWDTDKELQKLQLSYIRIDLEIFWARGVIFWERSLPSVFTFLLLFQQLLPAFSEWRTFWTILVLIPIKITMWSWQPLCKKQD